MGTLIVAIILIYSICKFLEILFIDLTFEEAFVGAILALIFVYLTGLLFD